jgi:hypothetical protein
MWSRKCGQVSDWFVPWVLSDFVPEGQTDNSQAVHCLGPVKKRAQSRQGRSDQVDQAQLSIRCVEQNRGAGPP